MKTFLYTCVVLLLASFVQDAAGLEGCEHGVDMVFVIDSSRSMTKAEFELQVEFVMEFSNDFKIGREDTQVSVLQYSHKIKKLFCFNEYTDNIAVMRAIKLKHEWIPGSTKTSKAFKYIRKRIFNPKCGMREHSTKIIILLTDGMPNYPDKAVKEANLLMDAGVTLVTIAIGNDIARPMLLKLASAPEVAFNTSNFFDLEVIRPSVAMEACKKINPDLVQVMKGCHVGLDIVFLVDHSRSLSHDDHMLQMDFVESLSRNFMVSTEHFHTRVSALHFAHRVYDHFCFHEFLSNVELSLAINHTEVFPQGSTNLGRALRFVRTKLFQESCGARHDSFKLVVIITDAKVNFPHVTFKQANKLKDMGVKIMTVGVGEIDERVLHPISSSHDLTFDNVHEVSVDKITAHVSSGACEIALNHNHTWTIEDMEKINHHKMSNAKMSMKPGHNHGHHHRHSLLHHLESHYSGKMEFADVREPTL